jgi:DNA polymerase theta
MSAQSGKSVQTHGFQTSIDVARQQTYDVTPVAGHKRLAESSADNKPEKAPSIRDTSNAPNNTRFRQGQGVPLGKVDFVRPSLVPGRNRLVASEIRSVTATIPGAKTRQHNADPDRQKYDQDGMLFLKHPRYNLSPALVANFASLGIKEIYPWQASCLQAPGLLEGTRHLVYTAPTGGGKSLVADVLMLKRIIERPSCKAILVLPYVALVQEKLKWLRRIVQDVEKYIDTDEDPMAPLNPYQQRWKKLQRSVRVTGYFGGSKTSASWADTDIAVCTIEKV